MKKQLFFCSHSCILRRVGGEESGFFYPFLCLSFVISLGRYICHLVTGLGEQPGGGGGCRSKRGNETVTASSLVDGTVSLGVYRAIND